MQMFGATVLASILACFSNIASVQAGTLGLEKGVAVLNATNFEGAVKSTKFPVLLAAFYTPNDEASTELLGSLEKAAGKKLSEMTVRVGKVNAVEDAALAKQHGVESFPSIVAFKDGSKHSQQVVALWQKQEIRAYASAVAGNPSLFQPVNIYNGLQFQWKLALRYTPLGGSTRQFFYNGFPFIVPLLVLLPFFFYCCCCMGSAKPTKKPRPSNGKKSSGSADPAEDEKESEKKDEDEKKDD